MTCPGRTHFDPVALVGREAAWRGGEKRNSPEREGGGGDWLAGGRGGRWWRGRRRGGHCGEWASVHAAVPAFGFTQIMEMRFAGL